MTETSGSWKQHPPPLYFFSGMECLARMNDVWPVPDLPWLHSMYTWGNKERQRLAEELVEKGYPLLFDSRLLHVAGRRAGPKPLLQRT